MSQLCVERFCWCGQRVEAIALSVSANVAWPVYREEVANLPRTIVVEETSDCLCTECTNVVLGFVDDLELHLSTSAGLTAVRSASRVGYSDLGAN